LLPGSSANTSVEKEKMASSTVVLVNLHSEVMARFFGAMG
jgi:hypothetical protein